MRLTRLDCTTMALLAVLLLFTAAGLGRVHDAPAAALLYALIIGAIPLLRLVARRWPTTRIAADFYPIVAVGLSYLNLNPAIDAVSAPLADHVLLRADVALFGTTPSIVTEAFSPPWLIEIVVLAYLTYYYWPVILGIVLYAKRSPAFERFALSAALCILLNQIGYVLVPAIGPRFIIREAYAAPLKGVWFGTSMLMSLEHTPMLRDCFPSGHTAMTLTVLLLSWFYARRVFWIMLPVAVPLVSATILCRFHYGIDLLAALPLVGISLAGGWILATSPRPGASSVFQRQLASRYSR